MYDYKAEFHDAVTELIAQDIVDRTERMAAVNALTDAYFDSVGKQPDAAEIERLTDYILREELMDPNPHKVAHNEYPFMSERQLDLRRDRETSLNAAEHVGADGVDYRVPSRRLRTPYERWRVDKDAKIRNEQRAERYKQDVAAGPVVKYNLRRTGGELTEPFTQRVGIGARWLADMGAVNEVTVELAEESAEIYVREAA